MESLKDLCLTKLRKGMAKSETILEDLSKKTPTNDVMRELITNKNDNSSMITLHYRVLLRDWTVDEENPDGFWDDPGLQIYYNPSEEEELKERFLEEGWSTTEIYFDFRRKVTYYNPIEKKFNVRYLLNINWDGQYGVNIRQHFATGDVGGRFDEEEFHHSIETEVYPEYILNDHIRLNQSVITK